MAFTVNGETKTLLYINNVEKPTLSINDKFIYANVKISIDSIREWNATKSRPTRYHFWTDEAIPFDCTVRTYLHKNNGSNEGVKTTTITAGNKLDVSWSTSSNYNVGNSGTGWYCIITPTNQDQWACTMPSQLSKNYYCSGSSTVKHKQTDNFVLSNFSISFSSYTADGTATFSGALSDYQSMGSDSHWEKMIITIKNYNLNINRHKGLTLTGTGKLRFYVRYCYWSAGERIDSKKYIIFSQNFNLADETTNFDSSFFQEVVTVEGWFLDANPTPFHGFLFGIDVVINDREYNLAPEVHSPAVLQDAVIDTFYQ